jgi:diamine N-acetyltransferase
MKYNATTSNKGVFLRQATQNDSDFFLQMKNNAVLQELLMCHPRVYSLHEINDWIARYENSNDSFLLSVFNEAKEQIGYFSIQRYQSYNKTAYFGIAIHPNFQRSGYGEKALNCLLEWARNELQLRKFLLEVVTSNTPAIKLYKKLGFREVGILREQFANGNIYQDAILMEKCINLSNEK